MRLAVLLVATSGIAHAEPHRAEPVTVAPSLLRDTGIVPRVLFLDRCAGGCAILNTANDATMNNSTIPMGKSSYTLSQFAFGDDEWNAVVKCVQDVFSPYMLTVTDQKPADGTVYNKTFVAGLPSEIGQPADVLGIAPLASNCAVLNDVAAFAFANQHTPTDRVNNICWTVAQESAHTYGLDHEYQFKDKTSACNDPMTYRTDCGGEKFFRDEPADCGEFTVRDCKCGRTFQDSDGELLTIFGPGTPTTTPPEVTVIIPAASGITVNNGFVVQAKAGGQRGVDRVQLVLNGHVWLELPGTGFGISGQPEIAYGMQFPSTVPDGNIDVQVRAIDDIGETTTSDPIRVTKGAACVDASTCLANQACTDGKCAWPTPLAAGEACAFNEACDSNVCDGTCVQLCDADKVRESCGDGFVCEMGRCAVDQSSGGGCCSSSGGPQQAMLGMFGLALLLRRRTR